MGGYHKYGLHSILSTTRAYCILCTDVPNRNQGVQSADPSLLCTDSYRQFMQLCKCQSRQRGLGYNPNRATRLDDFVHLQPYASWVPPLSSRVSNGLQKSTSRRPEHSSPAHAGFDPVYMRVNAYYVYILQPATYRAGPPYCAGGMLPPLHNSQTFLEIF